jgi:hypothetical protein
VCQNLTLFSIDLITHLTQCVKISGVENVSQRFTFAFPKKFFFDKGGRGQREERERERRRKLLSEDSKERIRS